ncbi:hypothetical protein A2419_02905 [Candidatus Adlerbacteria bacterium RIFOXYC1_FULL_48_26]|uniref:Secreted protein n=1 Tax=Candidatus Adlerbacteria bacterium RIFOXYC1_FULL_48_26 TaxID=1797247 RepID=A0A1F4Y3Q9_9BACT|nr:MAG: hypothetical protein A2419_02905 [Candidatus Adlerbacteria bacterium RIFOXYC1_FULL_48_26]OGC93559.1 MAG: hypothetical protein A2389_00745 [Candidatus Adlerbacteria bacterium RIFOXYB1_FULL_48_10]
MSAIRNIFLVAVCAAVLVFAGCNVNEARAHDPLTHQANGYSSAKNKSKGLCCDGNDFTYINPYSWERTDKGFRVHIQGKSIDVPADAEVENMKNPDGEAKVWLYLDADTNTLKARCFMPGIES